MALPTSGTISIGGLRGEFSDTGSSSLSEFYRGGSRVVSSASVPVSVPYTYYTTTYENQTTYQSQTSTQTEYHFDNSSSAQTFWYGNSVTPKYYIIWNGVYKRYISAYFTSYAHADGWTYSLNAVQYSIGDFIIGDVVRTRQVTTQVPVTTQVAVQNGPYTGYTTEYQNQLRNTSVPSSGSISLSQFYGGHN
jgi:hypothetical protein